MKRLILATLLLLPMSGIASSVRAIDPMPECYPCPPDKPKPTRDAVPVPVVIPAETR